MNFIRQHGDFIALFLLIVIDGMSFGMTLPVLIPLLNQASAHFIAASSSQALRHTIFGVLLFLSPIAYFLGAPLLGFYSDRFGRKPVLAICLIATCIAYICYAISFSLANLSLLMFSRFIAGFFTGSQAIAQAAMVDLSKQKTKLTNIASVALAMTIGLLLGPLIGGILSNSHYSQHFSSTTPFSFSAGLSIINLILLLVFFHETNKNHHDKNAHDAFFQLSRDFFSQLINRKLLLIFFLFELSWSLYYQSMSIIGTEFFHLDGTEVSYLVSYISTTLSVGLLLLLPYLSHRITVERISHYSIIIGLVSVLCAFFARSFWLHLLLVIPIAFTVATIYASLITRLSDMNKPSQQGFVMGISDSALSLAFAITGLLSAWLTLITIKLPLLISGCFLVATLIVHFTTDPE